ncbi:9,11-endoperoxide prostaglandin H2 reductase-like [Amphibalanus amphitrite]|uniref:9,11-endoperoxide prostaglandin H2 reductase-like n=1 Tax=Amphibalanus amphitrite TaxID=1232801 RepID=UPI001C90012F|nr:9,11-endoperoxide prostaglandin H2 reductase-like [Amphibalanus amphitrite]
MTPSVQLSNGMQMPLLGLGCWQADDGKDVAVAVETALLAGYRHIDTAYFYANEADVGRGIKAAIATGKVKRSDIFVTTKLPPIGMRPEAYLEIPTSTSAARATDRGRQHPPASHPKSGYKAAPVPTPDTVPRQQGTSASRSD